MLHLSRAYFRESPCIDRPFSKLEQGRADANRHFVLCKEDAKEVLVSQNMGGGKQLERSFHFDKVLVIV